MLLVCLITRKQLKEIINHNILCYSFSIDVRAAAVSCLKNILATSSGSEFWEVYKSQGDPMLIYLQPFRMPKKKVLPLIHLIYMT